jgi:tryptophan 2,3-dioxygenase
MLSSVHDRPNAASSAAECPGHVHPRGTETPTYWDYIKVESLLSLQNGFAADERALTDDEVLFIVVHQIDELWFKLALRELTAARDLLVASEANERAPARIAASLRRAILLVRYATQHFELIETLTTRAFLDFRDKLAPASGYQSAQFRELEILLGLHDAERIACGTDGSYMCAFRGPDGAEVPAARRVQSRLRDQPTLEAAFTRWLFCTPIDASVPAASDDAAAVSAFVDSYLGALAPGLRRDAAAFLSADDVDPAERAYVGRARAALLFLECYADGASAAWAREVVDAVSGFEQAFVIFRQRHARMVERIIGRRPGTGGSSGVEYLDETAVRYRFFRDVATARTFLLRSTQAPRDARPPVTAGP